jgi:hypothetical protein
MVPRHQRAADRTALPRDSREITILIENRRQSPFSDGFCGAIRTGICALFMDLR